MEQNPTSANASKHAGGGSQTNSLISVINRDRQHARKVCNLYICGARTALCLLEITRNILISFILQSRTISSDRHGCERVNRNTYIHLVSLVEISVSKLEIFYPLARSWQTLIITIHSWYGGKSEFDERH